MALQQRETRLQEKPPKDIYYFTFGPLCNDQVRKRREIQCTNIQAAYVPDYRLTFAFGGNANIVSKVGFEAHGLLMKLASLEDWEKLKKFEAGNTPTIRTVVPYNVTTSLSLSSASASQQSDEDDDDTTEEQHNADDDFLATSLKGAVDAYLIELPENVDSTLLDAPIERLPQERYLKLIANGMRQYGVDEDYVTDHIEACPFIPNRKPEEYFSFPVAKRVKKISLNKYQQLCARARVEDDLYFVLGNRVFLCGEHDPENPLAKWFETHGHGKRDCTYMTHLTVVDPDIPLIYDAKDVTPLHVAWAENHLVEVMEQYGMGAATRVYELVDNNPKDSSKFFSEDSDESEDLSLRSFTWRTCWKYFMCPLRRHHRR